ncbi:MAG TPA: response regulator [Flavisolibacter sp.]|nr:response regulator [Flavisolibacter sp.]
MQQTFSCFLVDNDEEDQEIFQMALQEVDPAVNCTVACNGVEALQMLDAMAEPPSFIFIDMNMPLMNGKQCLVEIRSRQRFSEVPVYMYSTSADPRSIAEVRTMGATDFIVKPSSFNELTVLLQGLLKAQNPAYGS